MGDHNERFCGHVNGRYNGHTLLRSPCYAEHMQHDWKSRLIEAIDRDGRSGRELSRKLKIGPNAISELRLTDKAPAFDSDAARPSRK